MGFTQVREGAVGDVALLRDNGGKHGAHLPTGSGLTVPYARGRVSRLVRARARARARVRVRVRGYC